MNGCLCLFARMIYCAKAFSKAACFLGYAATIICFGSEWYGTELSEYFVDDIGIISVLRYFSCLEAISVDMS